MHTTFFDSPRRHSGMCRVIEACVEPCWQQVLLRQLKLLQLSVLQLSVLLS